MIIQNIIYVKIIFSYVTLFFNSFSFVIKFFHFNLTIFFSFSSKFFIIFISVFNIGYNAFFFSFMNLICIKIIISYFFLFSILYYILYIILYSSKKINQFSSISYNENIRVC